MNKNLEDTLSINKKRLLKRATLTLFIIACFRLGICIPIPGIDQNFLYNELKSNSIVNIVSSFSQGNFFVLGLFTLGILPNINASIIIQFLTSFFPH